MWYYYYEIIEISNPVSMALKVILKAISEYLGWTC